MNPLEKKENGIGLGRDDVDIGEAVHAKKSC